MNIKNTQTPFSFSALVAQINKDVEFEREHTPKSALHKAFVTANEDAPNTRKKTPPLTEKLAKEMPHVHAPRQDSHKSHVQKTSQSIAPRPADMPKANLAARAAEISPSEEPAVPEELVTITFSELGLHENVLKVLSELNFIKPTPIQAKSIPALLEGKDLVGIAQTGTGKTGAFLLPTLKHLAGGRRKLRMPRCLVLTPTRELALQVQADLERFTKYMDLTHALIIGGSSMGDQMHLLDKGVDVLVATPGRLLDLFDRKKIMLLDVKHLIVDEADRMLDMGFMPDIERICSLVPFTRQTMLFSATMPPEIAATVERFMQAPVTVEASRPSTVNTRITQYALAVDDKDFEQREALRSLIQSDESFQNAIVFCNMKITSNTLAKSFARHGYAAAALHSDLSQEERFKNLQGFRDGNVKLLVASDVAARGLDVPNVSHVINFEIPKTAEDYVHRIGRTGRGGKTGVSITLISPHTAFNARKMKEELNTVLIWVDAYGNECEQPEWWETASATMPARHRRPSSSDGKSGGKPRGKPRRKP